MSNESKQSRPLHAPVEGFNALSGELKVGGIPLALLAARVGRTPFYAYDRRLITDRVRSLRQCLPSSIGIHYAMKCNPWPAVVHHLAALVDGIDVASVGELAVALDTGIKPETISFAGPGKSDAELRQACAAGIIVNVESEREISILCSAGDALGIRPRIAVRVNPDFELKSSGMKMSGGAKQFGIDAERVPALFKEIKRRDLAFEGLHIFSGSQNLRSEAIAEAQNKTLELAIRLAEAAPGPIRTLNIGGGFGIPYFPGDAPLDLGAVAANLSNLCHTAEIHIPEARIVLELGRYLVGEAGIYVCRIIDRKISRGEVFLVTDGGLHHHLAASGNFGQVIRKNYPVTVVGHPTSSQREIASVVGPLCTPLDLLADKMELPVAAVGDFVVVFRSGAYGASASPARFLSHPEALEVLV